MPDTLVLFAIFVAAAALAIHFADITKTVLIVLFLAAIGDGIAFLTIGLHWLF